MKKYSSGSFVDAALRVYGSEADTITSFPASIITNDGNITPWTIYGNTSAGQSVGEKTNNLLDLSGSQKGYYIDSNGIKRESSYPDYEFSYTSLIPVTPNTTYTFSVDIPPHIYVRTNRRIHAYDSNGDWIEEIANLIVTDTDMGIMSISFTTVSDCYYITINYINNTYNNGDLWLMLNSGSTALPYEPYGYKLPVVIGSTTTNIYMADVLRMSSGADPVYDIMSSTGVITRNVDTDGSPLPTPTTESFTAPTLATVAGSQSFTINTTVKPSSVSLTYTGWHTHADKQYSGGSWGAITGGQILRRKRTTKRKT